MSALRRRLLCRRNTLWDWLHLLLRPMAVAVVPLWLNPRTHVDRVSKSVVLTFAPVFAIIVIAGYTIPWAWTGFVGNSLWDWLNLIALPLAVGLTPILGPLRERWTRRHTMLALTGTVAFLAIVLAGYLAEWRWTGFTGNTLWDWLHLLLLPLLLLPMFVVPAFTPVVTGRMETIEEEQDEAAPEEAGGAVADGGGTEPTDRPEPPGSGDAVSQRNPPWADSPTNERRA